MRTGAVDAWSSWGVYVAQGRLVDDLRIVADGSNGVLSGLSYLLAGNAAIAHRRDLLLDFSRRLATARRWALTHPDHYAKALAAEIGVTEPVARLTFDMDQPRPIPIDDGVTTDAQKTADLFLHAGVIRDRLVVPPFFDASFNTALTG